VPREDDKLRDFSKKFLGTMKHLRNFLSHRIDTFPDISEVLLVLGGALSLAKILPEVKKAKSS